MNKLRAIVVVLLVFTLQVSSVHADPKTTDKAFEQLKSLAGKWRKPDSANEDFYILFEPTANNSVLVENWVYKSKSHSLTLYHLDGEALLATHYCPQGNQPRLILTKPTKPNTLAFKFKDATNLTNPEKSHQYSLGFEFIDDKTLLRTESYKKNNTIEQSEMRLIRVE